ncbi:uncharacterized protein PAC_03559 [Phialocephala subalpina]|uniref:Myb-like domain-containing protein n=1 Tax=Phialocephala subalpina TaxID=576137 RepID=A0A1L7WLM9_9HELO|nr:uncharacterized protein PAC_03559 [Phialocephala subalpina]
MPSQWDHKADRDLLLAIIEEGALKSVIWPTIAEKMNAKGYTFTHEACRQHFQKIRKESKSAPKSAAGNSPAAPTPRKRTSTTKTNGRTSNGTRSFSNDSEDFDTPSKKRKFKEEVDFEQAYQFKAENPGEVIDIEREEYVPLRRPTPCLLRADDCSLYQA